MQQKEHTLRPIVAALLALCVTWTSTLPVFASSPLLTQRPQIEGSIYNVVSMLKDEMAQDALSYIRSYWNLHYPNHNMVADHTEVYREILTTPTPIALNPEDYPEGEELPVLYEEDAVWTYQIRVQINGTATLTTAPESHPYLNGMRQAYSTMNWEEASHALPKLTAYQETLEQSSQIPRDFTAIYTLVYELPCDPLEADSFPTPSLYFGASHQTADTLRPDLSSYNVGWARYQEQVSEGNQALWEYVWGVQALAPPSRDVTYNPQHAITYAYDNGWNVPQYSSANGLGSDCANFLSHCLVAGGITADTAGNWYPSSAWGSYGSSNWIRTGYTASMGGVVLYLKNRYLFYQQYNPIIVSAGSILFHKYSSHVALLTYSDGEIMTYADHSNVPKEYRSYLWEGNTAYYYAPSPYILTSELPPLL